MLHPQQMTEEEYVAFNAWMIDDCANEISSNYRLPIDEARANAAKEIDGMLSQGLSTRRAGKWRWNAINHLAGDVQGLLAGDQETYLGAQRRMMASKAGGTSLREWLGGATGLCKFS